MSYIHTIETEIPLSPLHAHETLEKILLAVEAKGWTPQKFTLGTDFEGGDMIPIPDWIPLGSLGFMNWLTGNAWHFVPRAKYQPFRIVVKGEGSYLKARADVANSIGEHAGWSTALSQMASEYNEHVIQPTIEQAKFVFSGIGVAIAIGALLYVTLLLKK